MAGIEDAIFRRSTSRAGACCSNGTASITSRDGSPTGRHRELGLRAPELDPMSTPTGQLLVSSRNTHTVYKVESAAQARCICASAATQRLCDWGTGVVRVAARRPRQADGRSLFDNQGAPPPARSRGRSCSRSGRATQGRTAEAPVPPSAGAARRPSLGNVSCCPREPVRRLGSGAVRVRVRAPAGELLFDARVSGRRLLRLPRIFRFPWSATGEGLPSIAAARQGATRRTSGSAGTATRQVQRWLVLGGRADGALAPLGTYPRSGFETAIQINGLPHRLAVPRTGCQWTLRSAPQPRSSCERSRITRAHAQTPGSHSAAERATRAAPPPQRAGCRDPGAPRLATRPAPSDRPRND